MTKLTQSEVMSVKGKGFLRNRGTDLFSGRVVPHGTVFTAENFKDLSYIASTYGNGKLICTSRQAVEVPGIPFDKIDEVIAYAEAHSLYFGGTGNKVRPITACKGTTCVYGNFDTQALAAEIHEKYYLGWKKVILPHKFKISVGGCPNSCIKPSLNDFGIEGLRAPEYDTSRCRGCASCAVETACPMKAAAVKETMEGLKSASGFIRGELARRVNLRNTPVLQFLADTSIAYGVEMSHQIDEVIAKDYESASARGDEEPGGAPEA